MGNTTVSGTGHITCDGGAVCANKFSEETNVTVAFEEQKIMLNDEGMVMGTSPLFGPQ